REVSKVLDCLTQARAATRCCGRTRWSCAGERSGDYLRTRLFGFALKRRRSFVERSLKANAVDESVDVVDSPAIDILPRDRLLASHQGASQLLKLKSPLGIRTGACRLVEVSKRRRRV